MFDGKHGSELSDHHGEKQRVHYHDLTEKRRSSSRYIHLVVDGRRLAALKSPHHESGASSSFYSNLHASKTCDEPLAIVYRVHMIQPYFFLCLSFAINVVARPITNPPSSDWSDRGPTNPFYFMKSVSL